MKRTAMLLVLLALVAVPAFADNGAPNGAHYNLNIIGVSKEKPAPMEGTSGHTIFVPLYGKASIWLKEGAAFEVLDRNGTDGNGARFQLPNPDPDGDGTTSYSVFARALGAPAGKASMTTCAYYDVYNTPTNPDDDELICSMAVLQLDASTRPSKFQNVTKYLLYIYNDYDDDGIVERLPLFSEELQGYFWDYDNNGLKLAQLRFYQIPTTVPSTYPFPQ